MRVDAKSQKSGAPSNQELQAFYAQNSAGNSVAQMSEAASMEAKVVSNNNKGASSQGGNEDEYGLKPSRFKDSKVTPEMDHLNKNITASSLENGADQSNINLLAAANEDYDMPVKDKGAKKDENVFKE